MLPGCLDQLVVPTQLERDPVRDLEAGLLASLLHGADDLPGEALAAELLVEVELNGHGMAGFGLDLITLERLHDQAQVIGPQGVVLAPDLNAHLLAALDGRSHRG